MLNTDVERSPSAEPFKFVCEGVISPSKIFINYVVKPTPNKNSQTSAKGCFRLLISPSSSLGHSSQGSPQPSPGILLQQHFAFVVLKALGTEHFPFSKFVKQKLWRVSIQESKITDLLIGHLKRWNNLYKTLFLTEHFLWVEHMQIRLAIKRQVWKSSMADFICQFQLTCL